MIDQTDIARRRAVAMLRARQEGDLEAMKRIFASCRGDHAAEDRILAACEELEALPAEKLREVTNG